MSFDVSVIPRLGPDEVLLVRVDAEEEDDLQSIADTIRQAVPEGTAVILTTYEIDTRVMSQRELLALRDTVDRALLDLNVPDDA